MSDKKETHYLVALVDKLVQTQADEIKQARFIQTIHAQRLCKISETKKGVVLLMCLPCETKSEELDWKDDYLCQTCKHNRWAAKQLELKFGGRADLPLVRN